MMSSSNSQVPGAENDIWVENSILIRQLYILERKTLKKVKEVMEIQHGFPKFPLSTYEIKLRDKLNLRKKLKKTEWPVVYQHVQGRGEKETGIYINGIQISWRKAWKEIRRSGYQLTNSHQLRQLPAGVVVRTPSPTIPTPSLSPPSPSIYVPIEAQLDSTAASLQGSISAIVPSRNNILDLHTTQHVSATNGLSYATEVSGGFDFTYNRVFLEYLPINTFRKKLYSIVSDRFEEPQSHGVVIDQRLDVDVTGDILNVILGLDYRMSPPFSSLRQLGHSSLAPALNFDTYQFLAKVVYLISNKMLILKDPSSVKLFNILFIHLQEGVLLQFLRTGLPTARATWEALVPFSWATRRTDVFSFLLKIGLQHLDWILADGYCYLSMAASLGLLDIVHGLLKIGVRADDIVKECQGELGLEPAIIEAARAKSLACVEVLVQECDVNRLIAKFSPWMRISMSMSNFSLFLSGLGTKRLFAEIGVNRLGEYIVGYRSSWFSVDDEIHIEALDMLLGNGADVDALYGEFNTPYCPEHGRKTISTLYYTNDIPSKWRLSALDYAYYVNVELYQRLSPYSRKEATQITRPGICLSAKRGNQFLQAYLDSRLPQHPDDITRLLEIILAEQFFIEDWRIDASVVNGLVRFGVDINLPTMKMTLTSLFCQLVATATRLGITDDVLSLLRLLLCQGVVIDPVVVDAAITSRGLGALPMLFQPNILGCVIDIKTYGSYALCIAARFNNIEAVSWLSEAGVDINATISTPQGTKTIIALVTVFKGISLFEGSRTEIPSGVTTENLAHLIRCGARLRLGTDDSGSYEFLKEFLKSRSWTFDNLKLLLDSVCCPEDLATDHESLLSSWRSITIFSNGNHHDSLAAYELLLRRGCPIRRDCQLASYISIGGCHETIFRLLDGGADVNASSKDNPTQCFSKSMWVERFPIQAAALRGDKELIVQLLKRGADINLPAIGNQGRTALQGACSWEPPLIEDRRHKLNLIQFLIGQGANVNAPPAEYGGRTALQIAALKGDIGTALILLEHGANINASPGKWGGLCALDAAAQYGRLDMVKLLLSMAAHSHYRGVTGYESAIHLAVASGHIAVADSIREHIRTFGNCIIVDFGNGDLINAPNGLNQSSGEEGSGENKRYYGYGARYIDDESV